MSELRTPTEVVLEVMRLVGAGEHQAAAALFADTVDFSVTHAPGLPWVPEVRARADMVQFFDLLSEHVVIEELALETTVSEGNEVVLLGHLRDTMKRNGRTLSTRFALHVTVDDQRITRYHLYEDSYAVAQAYFGDPAP